MTRRPLRPHASLAVAICAVGAALSGAATAAAEPPDTDYLDEYPIAVGHYGSPTDFYGVFFTTPDGRSCGISPNGGPVGCDAVPIDAPAGTNQTVATSWAAAEYRHSDQSFARDGVDVLPEGYRLENWGTVCGMGHQGAVTCRTANNHGFVLAATYGVLW